MRVALLTGIFPPDVGGPATHFADVAAELRGRGHEVTVIAPTDASRPQLERDIVRLPRQWPWPLRDLAIAAWLHRHRADLQVLYATGLDSAAALGSKVSGRPLIIKVVGDVAWERARRLGLVNNSFEDFQRTPSLPFRIRCMQGLRNWALRHAEKVVVPAEYLRGFVCQWLRGPVDVEVIRNGVRLSMPSIPAGDNERPNKNGDIRAVFVGRLVEWKHVDVLIQAVKRTESATLEVVGDGPCRASLEDLADRLGVSERVDFLGARSHAEVFRILGSCDFLLLASSYEGLPHVAIEALACGVPIVSSPSGGTSEVVAHGESGLVVRDPDPAGFAAALQRLRDDPALRARLAAGAAEAAQEWSFARCADRTEAVLRAAVYRKPRVILLGKGAAAGDFNSHLRPKLEMLVEHVNPTIVAYGASVPRWVGTTRFVRLPAFRPRPLSSTVFYALAPAIAIGLAARPGPGTVVCQSPYEGAGAIWFSRLVPTALRPRVVVEVHGDWRTAARMYGSRARRLLAPVADRVASRALRRADRVRVVSQNLEDAVRDVGYVGEIDRFPTFSDLADLIRDPPPVAPPVGAPSIAFIGLLEPHKGIDALLEAWSTVRDKAHDARLLLAGDGAGRAAFEQRARALDLDTRIEFLGQIPHSDVRSLLDRTHALVLPSRSEGLARVIMEACARARPVIASDVGGNSELVEHGRSGLLVPPDDPSALAGAILELLADRDKALGMGAEARRRIVDFDPLGKYDQGLARLARWASDQDT